MTTTQLAMLPAEFADLEKYAKKWAVRSAHERNQHRLTASMEELEDFYETTFARAEAAFTYIDGFSLDSVPADVKNLMYLMCALSTVSTAVDYFHQPKIPDSGSTYLNWDVEPEL